MKKHGWATGVALAAFLGLASAPKVGAKPTDLPAIGPVQCPECCEEEAQGAVVIDVFTGGSLLNDITERIRITGIGLSINFESSKTESPTSLDSLTPTMVTAYVEEWLQQISEHAQMKVGEWIGSLPSMQQLFRSGEEASEPREPSIEVGMPRAQRAEQLFKIAENCRRSGALDQARTCYQQIHLLMPTSRLGQLAIDRLVEVEARMRETAEESELPGGNKGTEESSSDLRERTMPLGMVEVSY